MASSPKLTPSPSKETKSSSGKSLSCASQRLQPAAGELALKEWDHYLHFTELLNNPLHADVTFIVGQRVQSSSLPFLRASFSIFYQFFRCSSLTLSLEIKWTSTSHQRKMSRVAHERKCNQEEEHHRSARATRYFTRFFVHHRSLFVDTLNHLETFLDVLRYVYDNKVETEKMQPLQLVQLLAATTYYDGLARLRWICEDKIKKDLT